MESQDEAAKQRKCQLCEQSFDRTRSLRRHYANDHGLDGGDEVLKNTPPTPKKPCKYCGKAIANEWSHKVSKCKLLSTGISTSESQLLL